MDELGENMNLNGFSIDPNNELYLHHGDSPGMKLVTKVLEGDNYDHWNRSMTISLIAKNKIGFVNGTCLRPHNNPPLEAQWDRCNNMVISWIIHSVTPDIAESVIYCQNAYEIWKELYQRFGKSNSVKLYQVHKDLIMVEQGDLSISEYFTKFKKLKDQYRSAFSIPACECGSSQVISDLLDTQHTLQFLMGLNGEYNSVRGNILMMQPLPSVNRVYNLLIQEEKQREIGNNSINHPKAAVFQTSVQRNVFRPRYAMSHPRQPQGNYQSNFKQQGMYPATSYRPGVSKNMYCSHCHMTGHNVDNCFKIHGYPQHLKPRGRRPLANLAANCENNTNPCTDPGKLLPDHTPGSASITQDQYNNLVDLLSHHGLNVPMTNEGNTSSHMLASTALAGPFDDKHTSW